MKKHSMLLGTLAVALAFVIVTMGCQDVTDLINGGGDVTYTAEQEGGSPNTATSASIKLSFNAALSSLTAGEIHVNNDGGEVTKGELTGDGAIWHVALGSVTKQGNVVVSISKSGVESAVKTVAVYKASAVTDKAALETAISEANSAKSGVSVDTSAENVSVGSKWVTQAEMTALTDAITTAEEVNTKANATQTEVDNAATALNGAVSTFNAAKKDGTNTSIVEADKAALNTAITEANTAKSGVSVDTSAENVPVGSKWVTQAELTALTDAITTAEEVNTKANATQTEVDNAATALDNAVTIFNAAKKDGTKTGGEDADKAALETAITEANTAKSGVSVDTSAENVLVGSKWVTQAEMTALTDAITTAEGVNTKANATQTEVDNAVTALDGAVSTFNAAKKDGTKTGGEDDTRATLIAGEAVSALAADTSAIVTFTGATGLSLAAADFAVDNGGTVTEVSVSADIAMVTVSFEVNTFPEATKAYIVSIASSSPTIKGSATVAITQEAFVDGGFDTLSGLAERLAWLSNNAVSGGDYTIELKADEAIAPAALSYSGKTVTVTLKGDSAERTVSLGSAGSLFTVDSGVTLTLDNNVTLHGRSDNTASLVQVNSGGTLAMKGNAKITGNTAISTIGGGVTVNDGSFTMSGSATVSGNRTFGSNSAVGGVWVGNGSTFTMNGNASVSGNTTDSDSGNGGGVYVMGSGTTFTMSDTASVSGNTARVSGGVCVSSGGSFTMSGSASVSGNTATSDGGGGGVYVQGVYQSDGSGGTIPLLGSFTIKDSATVSGNTASSGGGVLVSDGIFTKTGGIIYGTGEGTNSNTASAGAAVYADGAHRRETTVGTAQNLSASYNNSQWTYTGQWDDPAAEGSANITIGSNYGTITISGSDGVNSISKSGAGGKPISLTLSAADGYTGVVWYVDGVWKAAGDSATINAASYPIGRHTVTFTGKRGGSLFSQLIPFAVVE
jgi:hypothetical protein